MVISILYSQEMGNLIVNAGGECTHSPSICILLIIIFLRLDIELQVTMVECLFRLTSVRERSLLAQKWFRESPSVLIAFSGLRDSEFEVVSDVTRPAEMTTN